MGFSLNPITDICLLSQLCPVRSPTRILRSRLPRVPTPNGTLIGSGIFAGLIVVSNRQTNTQTPMEYPVRPLLYLCNSNLPRWHHECCCHSSFMAHLCTRRRAESTDRPTAGSGPVKSSNQWYQLYTIIYRTVVM